MEQATQSLDQNRLVLCTPSAFTTVTLQYTPGCAFLLDFQLVEATFTRQANRLVISFKNGGAFVIERFFMFAEEQELPDFILTDDRVVPSAELLQAFEIDIRAAEVEEREPGSNRGFSEYGKATSSLLGGLDALGTLDDSMLLFGDNNRLVESCIYEHIPQVPSVSSIPADTSDPSQGSALGAEADSKEGAGTESQKSDLEADSLVWSKVHFDAPVEVVKENSLAGRGLIKFEDLFDQSSVEQYLRSGALSGEIKDGFLSLYIKENEQTVQTVDVRIQGEILLNGHRYSCLSEFADSASQDQELLIQLIQQVVAG